MLYRTYPIQLREKAGAQRPYDPFIPNCYTTFFGGLGLYELCPRLESKTNAFLFSFLSEKLNWFGIANQKDLAGRPPTHGLNVDPDLLEVGQLLISGSHSTNVLQTLVSPQRGFINLILKVFPAELRLVTLVTNLFRGSVVSTTLQVDNCDRIEFILYSLTELPCKELPFDHIQWPEGCRTVTYQQSRPQVLISGSNRNVRCKERHLAVSI